MAVVAAGTGLGEAILFWDGQQYHPLASEGGHCDFAPRTDQEIELLRYLRALSLAGLGDMAGAVADLEIADMRAPGRAEVVKHLVEWRRAFGQAA